MIEIFRNKYNLNIQLSRFQAQAISMAITSRPKCNLLVFGVGNDSLLWKDINSKGKTVFLETSAEWMATVKEWDQSLDCRLLECYDLTVKKSLESNVDLSAYDMPSVFSEAEWDVILIDAPPGYKDSDPRRALAIYWSSKASSSSTHIFVDDYERPLESMYADKFILNRPNTLPIVVVNSVENPYRKTLWSMGSPI